MRLWIGWERHWFRRLFIELLVASYYKPFARSCRNCSQTGIYQANTAASSLSLLLGRKEIMSKQFLSGIALLSLFLVLMAISAVA